MYYYLLNTTPTSTKNVSKNISPYQHSINPRKEFKELLQKLGFKVVHCSLRDGYYSNEENIEWSLDKFTGKSF